MINTFDKRPLDGKPLKTAKQFNIESTAEGSANKWRRKQKAKDSKKFNIARKSRCLVKAGRMQKL